MTKSTYSNDTFTSLVFWAGILLFAFLKWHLPDGRPPQHLTEFLAVGAMVGGGLLLFGEAGAWMMNHRQQSITDRGFGALMLLSAIALAIGLVGHSIWTNRCELVVALFFGAALYMALLRNPFVALTRS